MSNKSTQFKPGHKKVVEGDQDLRTYSKETLTKMGFNFDYHSHHVVGTYQKNEYIFCFNYGFRITKQKSRSLFLK